MSRYLSCIVVVAVALSFSLVVGAGCGKSSKRIPMVSVNAKSAGKEALKMFDADKDGKISGQELDKCPGLKAAAAKMDPQNGGITADMITAWIKTWQAAPNARVPVRITVQHNGKPLADATVTIVAEKFLGSSWKSCSGKTGEKSGAVNISIPLPADDSFWGVYPGFYRVEITKEGENIPAKYNTETTLGMRGFTTPCGCHGCRERTLQLELLVE